MFTKARIYTLSHFNPTHVLTDLFLVHRIVLNVRAPAEDKIEDVKDRSYEELESVLDKFPKYHTKIMLGDFNSEVGREDIFKLTIGNESLHEISNGVVKFATSKI
jgi:hypothetical protein